MSITTTDTQPARAEAAAQAAVALLPASTPLTVGAPTQRVDDVVITGQAVRARFTGAAQGEVAIVVSQDLVDALANTPMGNLDLSQALRPALEAAATTLGPVVVDPSELLEPAAAMLALTGSGGLLVPLTGEDGSLQAAVGLAVAAHVEAPSAAPSPGGAAKDSRPAFDLLHDVEMEVTAELG